MTTWWALEWVRGKRGGVKKSATGHRRHMPAHTLLKNIYFYLFAYLTALGISGGVQDLLAMACELLIGAGEI